MNPIFSANIVKGKLVLNMQDKFDKFLLAMEGKCVDVIVRPWRKNRSNQQNRFLWGVIYQLISDSTGYTREEVHDSMRLLFLKDESRAIPTLKSTTGLTTTEMNLYWEQIQQFAAEKLGVVIPDPSEVEL
jgi:hypothetical protein